MERSEQQTADLKNWLKLNFRKERSLVLVSHFVNVRALTGRSTSSGETVVVSYDAGTGAMAVLGTFE